MATRCGLFVAVVIAMTLQGASPTAGQTRYCDNPSARPTRLVSWNEGLPSEISDITSDGRYIYSLAGDSEVSLVIFDVRGARVKTLTEGRQQAGVHRVPWDGTNDQGGRVSSGVYFYRLVAGQFRDTKKMVLLR